MLVLPDILVAVIAIAMVFVTRLTIRRFRDRRRLRRIAPLMFLRNGELKNVLRQLPKRRNVVVFPVRVSNAGSGAAGAATNE